MLPRQFRKFFLTSFAIVSTKSDSFTLTGCSFCTTITDDNIIMVTWQMLLNIHSIRVRSLVKSTYKIFLCLVGLSAYWVHCPSSKLNKRSKTFRRLNWKPGNFGHDVGIRIYLPVNDKDKANVKTSGNVTILPVGRLGWT